MNIYAGFDGAPLEWTELGDPGAPALLLLHGLFSSAATNWVSYGAAAAVATAGFRLILPDFRAHGRNIAVGGEFPADTLAMDAEALVAHLGLSDYLLGGYSLGARTVTRMLARGARPRAALLSGMGLRGIVDGGARSDWFVAMIDGRGSWERGTAQATAEAFMTQNGNDPALVRALLRSQVNTPTAALAAIDVPVRVLCGVDDRDNGSASDLAAALPRAMLVEIPGNHMSAVTKPEFGRAIADWAAGLT